MACRISGGGDAELHRPAEEDPQVVERLQASRSATATRIPPPPPEGGQPEALRESGSERAARRRRRCRRSRSFEERQMRRTPPSPGPAPGRQPRATKASAMDASSALFGVGLSSLEVASVSTSPGSRSWSRGSAPHFVGFLGAGARYFPIGFGWHRECVGAAEADLPAKLEPFLHASRTPRASSA